MRDVSAHDSTEAASEFLTGAEVAAILDVSIRTVERMRADGILTPVYLPTGGRALRRRFRRADVEARVAAKTEPVAS